MLRHVWLTSPPPVPVWQVLWELLTWRVPWAGAEFWEIVTALLAGRRLEAPPRGELPGPGAEQVGRRPPGCSGDAGQLRLQQVGRSCAV
jgi:hypothetical protein